MEFRVLNYFLTVAQEENITKAAEVLHTTQSNLSRQLAELENTIDFLNAEAEKSHLRKKVCSSASAQKKLLH